MAVKEYCLDCKKRLFRPSFLDNFSGRVQEQIVEYEDGLRCEKCAKKKI